VIVAGGDTSGRAAMRVRALPIAGLIVRRSVVPAGALCTAASPQGWMGGEILLKGGQVGGPAARNLGAVQIAGRGPFICRQGR
jgi:uncharacterized protein YgbK (DUF1537 family)